MRILKEMLRGSSNPGFHQENQEQILSYNTSKAQEVQNNSRGRHTTNDMKEINRIKRPMIKHAGFECTAQVVRKNTVRYRLVWLTLSRVNISFQMH